MSSNQSTSAMFDKQAIGQVEQYQAGDTQSAGPHDSVTRDSRSGNRSKRETGSGFSFTVLDDLLAEPPEETPFLVDQLLPMSGSSILAGEPKAGKSTLVRTLILTVATGRDFCGRKVKKGPALYLSLEDKRAEIQRQFGMMRAAWNEECDPVLIHVGPAPHDPEVGIESLEAAILEHRPVLVVIDVLHRFMRIDDTNDYGKVSTAMEGLNDLARRMGCHIMALHHVGKGRDRRGVERILGSTAFAGAVDTAMFFCRKSDDRVLEAEHLRYGEELPKTIMRRDPTSGLILPEGLVAERNNQSIKEQILGVLAQNETMTQVEVRSALGGDTAETSKVLKRLVDTADVIRSGKGVKGNPHKYSLPVSPIEDKQESAESGPVEGPSAVEASVDPSLN